MNKKNVYRLFVLLICVIGTTTLYSENFFKMKEKIVDGVWKRISFLYLRPTLTLENLGYTSNIFYYDELEEPDWTADLGLDLQVSSILGNRFILKINENPYYSFFADNIEQRAFSNRLAASIYTYVGKFNLEYRFNEDYIKGRPTSEFGVYIRTRTRGHLFSIDFGKYTSLFFNGYIKLDRIELFEENYLGQYDLKRSLNREELHAGIRLNRIIFSRTRLFLNFEYYEYNFDYEILRDGIGRQISVGVEFPEIGKIKGSLEYGLKSFKAGNSTFRDYTKPFGSGKVTARLFRRFRVHLDYLINNFYSYWSTDQSYNEKTTGTLIEFYVTRNIKIGCRYRVGRLTYEYLTDGDKSRQDNFYTTALSLGLRVFKKMGIGIEYRVFRADSSVLDFIRSNDFIGGYLIHEF
ncbi:MAG: hypothetical protein KAW12_20300 [Candidatus Aminicenantes bacterium]|nr:hypothetical protein [Candidatus Aminicenantes bacterium]